MPRIDNCITSSHAWSCSVPMLCPYNIFFVRGGRESYCNGNRPMSKVMVLEIGTPTLYSAQRRLSIHDTLRNEMSLPFASGEVNDGRVDNFIWRRAAHKETNMGA